MTTQPVDTEPVAATQDERVAPAWVGRTLRRARVWLVFVASVAVWWLVVELRDVPAYLVPAPDEVLDQLFKDPALYLDALRTTAIEAVLGFAIAAVLGVLCAILMARWSILEDLLYPYLNVLRITPVVAVIPLLVIWFGHGLAPIVVVVVLIAFFPIVVGTLLGLKSVDRSLIELMMILNASELTIMRRIRLPNSMPHILASFRISAPLAVIGALVGEFVGGTAGLGYQLVFLQAQFNTPGVFLLIILSSLLGIAFFNLVVISERRLIRWHPSGGDG